MCKMKYTTTMLVTFIILSVSGLNEKQMEAAVKMVKNVCKPKTKATDADIDKMHKGDWNIDRTAMCYMSCAMNMYKLLNKDNSFNHESALLQLKQLPESFKEPTRQCMEQCKDAVITFDDTCAAAYELAKCMYFCNPEKVSFRSVNTFLSKANKVACEQTGFCLEFLKKFSPWKIGKHKDKIIQVRAGFRAGRIIKMRNHFNTKK